MDWPQMQQWCDITHAQTSTGAQPSGLSKIMDWSWVWMDFLIQALMLVGEFFSFLNWPFTVADIVWAYIGLFCLVYFSWCQFFQISSPPWMVEHFTFRTTRAFFFVWNDTTKYLELQLPSRQKNWVWLLSGNIFFQYKNYLFLKYLSSFLRNTCKLIHTHNHYWYTHLDMLSKKFQNNSYN
jgi:hypothetical protein